MGECIDPTDPAGPSTWIVILGDPAKGVNPLDPLMFSTYRKLTGTNPITGNPLVDSTMPNANPINGHEYTNLTTTCNTRASSRCCPERSAIARAIR